MTKKIRCPWAGNDALYVAYHDEEWGRVVRDGRRLFEKICLEGQQAGLAWIIVLRKREAYRLNVSEKERYKLLALVLGCNEDNARRVMSGTYPAKTNQKEIDDFANKYLSE